MFQNLLKCLVTAKVLAAGGIVLAKPGVEPQGQCVCGAACHVVRHGNAGGKLIVTAPPSTAHAHLS